MDIMNIILMHWTNLFPTADPKGVTKVALWTQHRRPLKAQRVGYWKSCHVPLQTSKVNLAGFFVRFEGNSILPKSLKLDFFPWNSIFFPMKLDFSAILRKFYISWWILEENLSGVTLFMPFLLTIILEISKKLEFLSKNGWSPSKNEEICSQK